MIWEITRSYRYDPDRVKEAKRLLKEFAAEMILKEIREKKNMDEEKKTVGN